MRNRWMLAMLLASGLALGTAAQDKDSFTPMPLDAGFGRMDTSAPAIAPEEIIRQFAAKESEFQQALNHYTYRRYARVQTIDDDNKVDGEWYQVDDVIFDPDGRRTEKISQYNVKYVGRQKVDEVECYAFDVAPKIIEKKHRDFDGRLWVDATGLQIVVTNGRRSPDGPRKNSKELHPPLMTWRQQVDGNNWFPVYTKGEGVLHFSGGSGHMVQNVHIRDTIKYTDYKQFGSTIKVIDENQDVTPDAKQPDTQPKK